MTIYRGRFAPTPSGPLHFGSMVAAVGSYCDARAHRGMWQVRIDDLDPPRVVKGAADSILRCIDAFGLEWDGDVVYQSRRDVAYHAALHRLREAGRVFACACSRKDIVDVTGEDAAIYPGTCRNGLPPGRLARALRLRVADETIAFEDLLQGRIERHLSREIGDFVLYRSDHVYAYHLACAVDDAEEGISHVVRGADLIDSAPRQIYIQHLLNLPTPHYLHLPVATDPAGAKLSKQTLAYPVDSTHPAPVIRAVLDFLGQQPAPGLDRMSAAEALGWAIANWSRNRLPRSPSAIAEGFQNARGAP
jgi:glutamyl-Q tRNA(Asp) synthetase